MKIFIRIAAPLLVILIFGLIFSVINAGVIFEIKNGSQSTIRDVSINYGRGAYLLSEIKSGESVKNGIGKIGEGANFEITWKYGDNNVGRANYSVYFNDGFESTIILIAFPDEKTALLEYRGKIYKPYVKSDT